jgi:hypothetical protein
MHAKPFAIHRRSVLALTGLAALGLAGCAALQPAPRTVGISQAKLLELIAGQFPFNNRYLELFDVSLASPRLRLIPAENRIGTELGYSIGASLLGSRTYQGTLNLSYGLRFEPSDGTVRLSQVRVEDFEVPGVPPAFASRANRLGGLLAENLLKDFVVHRLKPEDLQAAKGWGYQPGALQVVPGGLQLQLNPVQR